MVLDPTATEVVAGQASVDPFDGVDVPGQQIADQSRISSGLSGGVHRGDGRLPKRRHVVGRLDGHRLPVGDAATQRAERLHVRQMPRRRDDSRGGAGVAGLLAAELAGAGDDPLVQRVQRREARGLRVADRPLD
ncbi:MAG: hypothetical protein ABEJ79_10420 [Halolamina sp.]